MAESNWYWAEGEERNGPVTPAAIARLVADGKLGADDRIWKDGMPEWIPVSKVPALAKYLKKPAVAAPAAAVAVAPPAFAAAAVTAVKAQSPVKSPPAVKTAPPLKVEAPAAKPMRDPIAKPMHEPIARPVREAVARPAREVIFQPVAEIDAEPQHAEHQNGRRAVVEVSRAEVGYHNAPGASPSFEAGYRNDPGNLAPAEKVGYYNPTGSMPARATATLAKHATPRGDVGDWPLDDARVAQFEQALKLRKKIDSAASLFRLLLLLTAIGTVLVVFGIVTALTASHGSTPRSETIALITAGSVCVASIILYYFAWKGTVRSQSWAPLTMGILFVLSALANVAELVMLARVAPRSTSPELAVNSVVIFIAALFAYIAFRAFFAIPKYLRQPAWCQELLSKTSA